jgi:drug/metabolite transporter (DMT)-like permease
MAVVLALLSAVAYGASDFTAGLASRRAEAGPVGVFTQSIGMLTAVAAVFLFPGSGASGSALAWGALSGIGSGLGTLCLYRGLAAGRMTVVATVSAVLTAVIPVVVGVLLGNHLGLGAAAGIMIAIPAILLVSWQPDAARGEGARSGLLYGVLAGVGFALLFIALDQAGTHAGAWPLVPGQLVSVMLIIPFALRPGAAAEPVRSVLGTVVIAGVLSGTANLLFLAATGHGQLAVVAVLTALYPAVTVLLARVLLAESWSRAQVIGLVTAAAAIVLVSAG